MKKSKLLFVLISLVLVLFVSVPNALAYFSTYTITKGTKTIHIQDSTQISEKVEDWTKKIVVKADPDSDYVYVRVKVYAPSYILKTLKINGDGWTKDGDYFYYGDPINDGNQTNQLDVLIDNTNLPTDSKDGDEFHIVVVYESIPASYDENNNMYADWENSKITVFTEGGNS